MLGHPTSVLPLSVGPSIGPSVEVFKVLLDVLKVFEDVKVLLVAAE